MTPDPADDVRPMGMKRPSRAGRGSGKDSWIAYCEALERANVSLFAVIEEQTGAIREREAEIALLKAELAKRKPAGSRERLPAQTVDRIEAAITRGESVRGVAAAFGVSAMTVSRIGKRLKARQAVIV